MKKYDMRKVCARAAVGFAFILSACVILTGCAKRGENKEGAEGTQEAVSETPETEKETVTIKIDQPSDGNTSGSTKAEKETESSAKETAPPADETKSSEAANESGQEFSFSDLAGWEFYFSSGAGGWRTVLHVHDDGTFDGQYMDSNMGDAGDGYSSTVHLSNFTGRFTEPEKVDRATYRFEIESIEYPLGFGEEIKDETRYYYETAYGLDNAEELLLYLPGSELDGLPEGYLNWVGYRNQDEISGKELPFYGLYNVAEAEGFSSSYYDPSSYSAAYRADEEIAACKERTADLRAQLDKATSQTEKDEISGQIYAEWDSALNSVWAILKETLDDETMNALTAEERVWIEDKEKSVKDAAAEYEGGTGQAFAQNTRAAEMTEKRVYELREYLN